MLNIYNYNNIIHNQSITISSNVLNTLITDVIKPNYNNESWFVRFSIAQLIKNHAHLGGASDEISDTSYWFLSSRKNNFIFINMQYTLIGLRGAILAAKGTIRNYQKFAFVNNDVTSWGYTTEYADIASEPYFIYQWVGGAFTNIKKLWPMYWNMLENKTWEELSRRQCFIKMSLNGYRLMHSIPKLVFFNTIKYSVKAAAEAHAMFIGSFGLLDVDAHSVDPTVYLPSNDDSGITLSYYNSIFCKLILKEKYRMVKNFIAKKRLLRSVREHKHFNVTLRKHMRTRALLEIHHAKNKWLHPVVWNTLKYTRRLFSFKMFPNLWDKSIVHKVFKSFHEIKYSYFAGSGKYSRAVKEYEKKIYRFYKIYLNTLFTINSKTLEINSISNALYRKYITARKFYYINLKTVYKRFAALYKEMLFVYKWMFDLEIEWYGPSLVNIFRKYKRFLKNSQKEIFKLTNYLKIYRKKLETIRIINKKFIFYKNNKISLIKNSFKLSNIFKAEDTWGDQFMPTKYKVLKLPYKKKKIKKNLFFLKKKLKKSNPKHSLFMRQRNYKYSSAIWQMRKRPWLPIKNPIYYIKEPRFFYQDESLKRHSVHYTTKKLKKRAELYLNNFLPEYFMALKQNKIKFNDKFLYPNSYYNVMPKRYNIYSIYLSSRFNSKLWFLLLYNMKNKKNIHFNNKLKKHFNINKSSLNNIIQPIFNRKRNKQKQFTIKNIYNNYIKQSLPLKGQPFYESRGEMDQYLEQLKRISIYFNTSPDTILNTLPKNIFILFQQNKSIYHTINYFSKEHLTVWKNKNISQDILYNLTKYLKSIFNWQSNYNYKQIIKKFSKANKFFNNLYSKRFVNTYIPSKSILYNNNIQLILNKNKSINIFKNITRNNYLLRTLFFPRQTLPLTQHKFLFNIKNIWPIKKKLNTIVKTKEPKKSFYQMWLDRKEQKHKGIQTILDRDINFYLKKKQFFSTQILSKQIILQKVYSTFKVNLSRSYNKKPVNNKNDSSLINELLIWNSYKKQNNKLITSSNFKKYNKHKVGYKNNYNFKRRGNFNFRNKKFNPRFQKKSPFYIKQQRNFLRKRRQQFFRPFFSINDRSVDYLESNLKNLLKFNLKTTISQFYFLLLRFFNKLKNLEPQNQINYYYILLKFCYKLLKQRALYSINFVSFLIKVINFLTKKLQIQVLNNLEVFSNTLKHMHFNLISNFKQATKSKFIFKYKYFIDPYVKFHLWPYNYNLYGTSTFISFFWEKKLFYFRHHYPQTRINALQKTVEFFGKKFDRNKLNLNSNLFLSQASRIDRQFYYIYGKEKYKTWFNQKLMLSPTIRLSARNLLQSILYRYHTKIKTSNQKIKNRNVLKEVLLRFQKLKYKRFISVREAIFNDFMDRVSSVDDYFVDKHITPELFMIRNYGVKVFLKRDWWRFFDSSHFIVWLARKPWVSWEVEYEVKSTLRWFNNNTVYFRFV